MICANCGIDHGGDCPVSATPMATVSRDLLAMVLTVAESNSYSTEAEFSCSSDEGGEYRRQRELIAELRRQAGIGEEPDVTGQGFFGAMIALKEKSDKT